MPTQYYLYYMYNLYRRGSHEKELDKNWKSKCDEGSLVATKKAQYFLGLTYNCRQIGDKVQLWFCPMFTELGTSPLPLYSPIRNIQLFALNIIELIYKNRCDYRTKDHSGIPVSIDKWHTHCSNWTYRPRPIKDNEPNDFSAVSSTNQWKFTFLFSFIDYWPGREYRRTHARNSTLYDYILNHDTRLALAQ